KKMSISYLWIIRYSFFLILFLPLPSSAAPTYDYNQAIQDVYYQLLDLDFAGAKKQLAALEQSQPDNLARYHLQNYYDFFQVYTSDNQQTYKTLRQHRDQYLKQLVKGPKDSPWHLFSQADVHLQWALLKFRFGDYWSGFLAVKKAFQLLEKNQKKYPDFAPNYKDLGILHAMVGTVPDQYQWGLQVLTGLQGTVKQGKTEMRRALADQASATAFLHQETSVLYCFLLLYLDKDPSEAWALIKKQSTPSRTSLLTAYTYATVAAQSGHNDQVIELLEQRTKHPNWSTFPFLDFVLGNAKLRKLDTDAVYHFERFLKNHQGQNDLKAAHLRLAWCALLKKDKNKYLFHITAVQNIGNKTNGRDKDAFHLANLDLVPNLQLIKARLLFDGGYYKEANSNLLQLSPKAINNIYEALEFAYRKARIAQRLHMEEDAKQHYQTVIDLGEKQPYYFACNSALQLGIIFENEGQKKQAAAYFKQCLRMKPDMYKTGLHLSAKAGLQRLE
ncbi:MAG: hypothetical protein AAF705_01920, partial [Bacteroidota bacterium]